MGLLTPLQEGGVGGVIEPAALLQLGDGDARVDAVNADLLRRQLQRQAARQLVQRRLGGVVGQQAGEGAQAVDAGDVDNVAAAGHEVRRGQRAQLVDGAHVDAHDAVVLLERAVLHAAQLQDAGAVDEHVQPAVLLNSVLQQPRRVRLARQFRLDGQRPPAAAGRRLALRRPPAAGCLSVGRSEPGRRRGRPAAGRWRRRSPTTHPSPEPPYRQTEPSRSADGALQILKSKYLSEEG